MWNNVQIHRRRCRPPQGTRTPKRRRLGGLLVIPDSYHSLPTLCSLGGNESGLSSEQTYDRVESTTQGSETRAARCKLGSFSHSGLSSSLIYPRLKISCRRLDCFGDQCA